MRYFIPFAKVILIAFIGIRGAVHYSSAHEINSKNLTIYHPFLLVDESGKAYGFLSIENEGLETEYLLNIIPHFSSGFELWKSQPDGDILQPYDLTDGIEIPPGDAIHFEPEELELLFVNLNDDLEWFDPHTALLVFKNAGTIEVEFEVEIP